MHESQARNFCKFVNENENIKKELKQNLENYNLLNQDENKQRNIILDEMEKLSKKYNFDIDKTDLEETFYNIKKKLSDDEFLSVSGGFAPSGIAAGLLLLTGISSASGTATAFASGNGTPTASNSDIVQNYEIDYEEKFLDSNPENDKEHNNEQNNDKIDVDNQGETLLQETNNQTEERKEDLSEDTTNAEIAFSLKVLNEFPKKGEPGFDKFLVTEELENLNENRVETIKHKDRESEIIKINEKEIFVQMANTVREIVQKVKSRTPGEDMDKEDINVKIKNNEISKNYKLPEQMRIAKAIYRWVAKNISYDFEAFDSISNKDNNYIKPQDAIFVYSQKSGVCGGYSLLINEMMRIAGIPSTQICSIKGKGTDITHAFNAIYLEDTTNNREGWTLIDSTWASPKSDRNFLASENEVESLMEGTALLYPDLIEDKFNKNDEYAKEIEEIIDISWEDQKKMDDNEIFDLNKKTEDKLKELNKKYNNGMKFEKIEFSKSQYEGLQIKYKTNLTLEEAVKLNNEKKAKIKEQNEKYEIELMMSYVSSLFVYKSDELNDTLYDVLNAINSRKDRINSVKSEKYCKRVMGICANTLKKYGSNIKENADNINKEIQNALEKLNPEYQDIVTFKNLTIYCAPGIEDNDSAINVTTSLSYEEAKNIVKNNPLKPSSAMTIYFPGFYSEDIDFIEANKSIISNPSHKIDEPLNIDDVIYTLSGNEGSSVILIYRVKEIPFAENLQIPSYLSSFGSKIRIGSGIKSIILNGDETIDLSSPAYDLESINTENSNKYIAERCMLYEKNPDGSKGRLLKNFIKKFDNAVG